MKVTKGHIRAVDVLIGDACRIRPGSIIRYFLSTAKGYNKYVSLKYMKLTEAQKLAIDAARKTLVAKAARRRQELANMNSRARRGIK